MAGIKALTETGSGLAQVFDITPLTETLRAEQEAKEQAVLESALDYDPNDIWTRDMGKFTNDISGYEQWTVDNYDRLTGRNGTKERMLAWAEKKQKENEIRNNIAASKQAGAGIKALSELILKNPAKYDTPENRKAVEDFMKEQSDEMYGNREAWNVGSVEAKIKSNAKLDFKKMIDHISNSFFSSTKIMSSGNKTVDSKRSLNDPEGYAKYIDQVWNNGDPLTGNAAWEIQGKYGGDKDKFAQDMLSAVDLNVQPVIVDPNKGKASSTNTKNTFEYNENMSKDLAVGSTGSASVKTMTTTKRKGALGLWSKYESNVSPDEVYYKTVVEKDAEGNDVEVSKPFTKQDGVEVAVNQGEVLKDDAKIVYNIDAGEGISFGENAFRIPIPANTPGYDMISGTYNPNLLETAASVTVDGIINAKYAVAPVYARFTSVAEDGSKTEAKKLIKPGEMIPAGATLYKGVDDQTPIEESDKMFYINEDLFASIQSSNIAIREKEGEGGSYSEKVAEQTGNQAKTKGMVRLSDIEGFAATSINQYPGLKEQIEAMRANTRRVQARNEAIQQMKKK